MGEWRSSASNMRSSNERNRGDTTPSLAERRSASGKGASALGDCALDDGVAAGTLAPAGAHPLASIEATPKKEKARAQAARERSMGDESTKECAVVEGSSSDFEQVLRLVSVLVSDSARCRRG